MPLTVGDYSAAVTYYNNAIQMDKNHASAYPGRATALNMLGKYNDAIASADSALAIKPMDAVALNARAFAFFKLGQYEDATAAYDKLFIVEQNRKEAYCNQAYAYLILNDTSAPALVAFDRCTLLDSENFEAWNNKGLSMMQAGKYDAALSAFDRATIITIKNATVWNNKGKALMALGKPTDALECFNKALGINPDFADAKANKADAIGKQQSFNISGTITPKVTISRIGTFYTTRPPATHGNAGYHAGATNRGYDTGRDDHDTGPEEDDLFTDLSHHRSWGTGGCRGYCCGDEEEVIFFCDIRYFRYFFYTCGWSNSFFNVRLYRPKEIAVLIVTIMMTPAAPDGAPHLQSAVRLSLPFFSLTRNNLLASLCLKEPDGPSHV